MTKDSFSGEPGLNHGMGAFPRICAAILIDEDHGNNNDNDSDIGSGNENGMSSKARKRGRTRTAAIAISKNPDGKKNIQKSPLQK